MSGLGQGVHAPRFHHRREEGLEIGPEALVLQRPAHEGEEGLLVGGIGAAPGGVDLGLADRLLHGRARPLHVEGPRPHQGLVEEVLGVPVGEVPPAVALVPRPTTGGPRPIQRSGISESTARRARTSSLRLVSWVEVASMARGRVVEASERAAWKSSNPQAEPAGIPAHLVQAHETVERVERGVLHPLGRDRSGQLLEAHDQLRLPDRPGGPGAGCREGSRRARDRDRDGGPGPRPGRRPPSGRPPPGSRPPAPGRRCGRPGKLARASRRASRTSGRV